MPPRKYKVDHRRGGGGKHVSGADDVKARNEGEESAYDKARTARAEGRSAGGEGGGYAKGKKDESEEESEEEEKQEEKQKPVKPAKKEAPDPFGEVCNPNAAGHGHIDKTGVQELTRRQREEIEKEKARRRYEELHKAGKTDEAKADLARLEEVKKRRADAAAKKKAEEEAVAPPTKEDARAIGRAALIGELKASMGDEASSSAGRGKSDKVSKKEKKDKDNDDDAKDGSKKKSMNGADVSDIYSFVSSSDKVKEEGSRFQVTDGTIEACREAEADFM